MNINRIKYIIGFTFLFLFQLNIIAQEDSIKNNILISDTVKESVIKIHSPKRAAIYSAIIPGWGQAYNKKWWKIPIVYAGIGTGTYFAIDFQKKFNRYKNAYLLRVDGGKDEFAGILSETALNNEMDRWVRNRDLCIAGIALFYFLNIVDASVDAYLMDFDVSDNLSINIKPQTFNYYSYNTAFGAKVIFNF